MVSDFGWALLFFLWCEALSLPLRFCLAAGRAPADIRRFLSRVAGAVILLIPLWFAAHGIGFILGPVFSFLWVVLAYWIGIQLARKSGADVCQLLGYGERWRREAGLDFVTFAVFLAVVAFRRWVPEMTTYVLDSSAAEKFMNGMIWWSTWHARDLPPDDYWLAGQPLTYYYWGHFYWAWVARVGGFPVELALTLSFARLSTMVWEACYLLARSFGMRIWGAVLAGMAAAWGGNWEAVKGAWVWWQAGGPGNGWAGYDFWAPSRAISQNLVDEFPAFSTVLGDFHSHHLALPWVVAWLAVMIGRKRWFGSKWVWGTIWIAMGVAAVLSNIWNLPLMGGAVLLWLSTMVFRTKNLKEHGQYLLTCLVMFAVFSAFFISLPQFIMIFLVFLASWAVLKRTIDKDYIQAFVWSLLLGGVLGVAFVAMRAGEPLPLQTQQGNPGGIVGSPIKLLEDLPELHSTLPQLWDMWGLSVLPLLVSSILLIRRAKVGTLLVCLLAFIFLLLAIKLPPLACVAFPMLGCAMFFFRPAILTRRSVAALFAACAILGGLEIYYIDDAMVGALERYNTYFKLSYPVWPVLMVVGAQALVGACRLRRSDNVLNRSATWVARALCTVWLCLLSVYILCAAPARIARARAGDQPPREPTLNAYDFLNHQQRVSDAGLPYFVEADMLRWIREHVPAGEVVAEAAWVTEGQMFVGGYDFHGRVASLGGRPVPLGWAHHEVQWRGVRGMELTAERQAALDRLYLAETPEAMRDAAKAVGAKWVYYGVLEHDQYARRMGRGKAVLRNLSVAGKLAAALPAESPGVFLFDFGEDGEKME